VAWGKFPELIPGNKSNYHPSIYNHPNSNGKLQSKSLYFNTEGHLYMKLQNTHFKYLSVSCLCVAASLLGCSHATDATSQKKTTKPVPVKLVSVTQQKLALTSTQPATVLPFYQTEIRAKVSGYVKQVKADIGDYVKAGTVLATIDVPEMQKQHLISQARIKQFESEEKRAEAGIELSTANVRSAEAKLVQAKSELNRTKALVAAAQAEFSRTSDLVQRRSLESRILDEVRKKRDSELANQETMASAINSAVADVVVAQAKQKSAHAELQVAQAQTVIARRQLEELDVLLGYANLKAPFSGSVTTRSIAPGDLVREGNEVGKGEPLFVLNQIEKVRIQIPVPEADAALINRGDLVTLSFPSFPAEKKLKAAVTRFSGTLDPSTRTMLVEVEVPNPKRKLIPGMFGQATITLSTRVAANMLPARAIRFESSGQAYVYAVSEDDTVSVVQVTTGIDNGQLIEVLSGIQPGQKVVDAHLKRFTTGQKVSPVKH
jgi:HlyD family secretion protein